jgi:hypothetical protein
MTALATQIARARLQGNKSFSLMSFPRINLNDLSPSNHSPRSLLLPPLRPSRRRYRWLEDVKDAQGRRPTDEGYDARTLLVPKVHSWMYACICMRVCIDTTRARSWSPRCAADRVMQVHALSWVCWCVLCVCVCVRAACCVHASPECMHACTLPNVCVHALSRMYACMRSPECMRACTLLNVCVHALSWVCACLHAPGSQVARRTRSLGALAMARRSSRPALGLNVFNPR